MKRVTCLLLSILLLVGLLLPSAFASELVEIDAFATETDLNEKAEDTTESTEGYECEHIFVTDEAKVPTCTETGLTEGSHCGICGEVLVEQVVILVKGHHYVEGRCANCDDLLPLVPYYEQCSQPMVTTGANFPELNTKAPSERVYLPVGYSLPGITYSSVFRDGTDALWNYNPSTFYSAVANPASILYTENKWGMVYNAASYYGSVCSTTAMKSCGYKYPYMSYEIPEAMMEKTNHSIGSVTVDDILWRSGHVAGVIGVSKDANDNVTSVTCIEQSNPGLEIFDVTAEMWDSYFESNWKTIYYGGEKDVDAPAVYPENNSIIFSRGNNTYVTDWNEMLFYIPTASTVYFTKDGETTEYSKSVFNTKTVNDTIVYDLSELFDGVGDYYFHTEENTTDICIKVVDLGEISIVDNNATLSNYANCTPVCYHVIRIVPDDGTYDFYGAPEGYTTVIYNNSYKDITDDSFAVEKRPDNNNYKVEVFYDTGFGWARALSENVFREVDSPYLQQLPENLLGCTNLYEVLKPMKGYYAQEEYRTDNGEYISVVFPVSGGDRLMVSSFVNKKAKPVTAKNNGSRVTFLKGECYLISKSSSEVYAEYKKNGYITVPEGATAVGVCWEEPHEENWAYLLKKSDNFINHKPVYYEAQASTCTKKGSTAGVYCTDCEKWIMGHETIAKCAHTYDSKTKVTKATLTRNGKIENVCSVCGYVSSADEKIIYYPKTIKLSKKSYACNGEEITPTVIVKDSKGTTLKKDTDYTIKCSKGRKNPGTYSVTVTFIGKYTGEKKQTFKISPGATKKITAKPTTKSIKLTWSKVTGATGYRVYKYNSKTKSYAKLKDVKGTSLKISELSAGTKYKYRVKAYYKSDSKVIWSEDAKVIQTATKPTTPSLKVTTTAKGKATLKWSDVSGESGYVIYYSTSKKSGFKKYSSPKANATKKTVSKLKSGKKYYFRVKAYVKTSSGVVYSGYKTVGVKIK